MIQLGDFILFPVSPSRWTSKLVGWGERLIGQDPSPKSYSHVAIVGPDLEHMYQAYWPKIQISPISLQGNEIYRIKGITSDQIKAMMLYCQSQVGQWYDMLAILTFGKFQIGGTEVCSQLAYNAGLAAGVVLYPPEILESPDDIAASNFLEKV